MQELRLVAVSEDGSYLVLATAGRGTRFTLPVDDRLRAAVRGHFSRLGQFEIEVESPLRPKEIQARIRAGETADEIAESAGIPVERVRWFEGPVLQEREYMAQQAQRVAVRRPGESAPGPPLGEMVEERLGRRGIDLEDVEWDSWKCEDSTWRVRLSFFDDGRPYTAEWGFDPRRRHVSPHDEEAAQLSSLVLDEPVADTVTPLMPRRPAMKVVSDPLGASPEPRHDRVRREYIVERGRMVTQPEPVAPPEQEPRAEPYEFAESGSGRFPAAPRHVEPDPESATGSAPERRAEPAAGEAEVPAPSRAEPSHAEPSHAEPSRTEPSRAERSRAERPMEPSREPSGAGSDAPETSAEPAAASRRDLTEPKAPAPRPAAHREPEQSPEPAREADRPRPKRAAEPREAAARTREQPAEPRTGESRTDEPRTSEPRTSEPRTGEPRGTERRTAAARADEQRTGDEAEAGKGRAQKPAGKPAAKPAPRPERPRRQEPAEPAPDQVAAQVKEPAAVTGDKTPVSAPPAPPQRPRRKSARGKRASVPSWDEIMFGARRPD
ncbi:septation protein SepH [Actinomadura alba]|uniref:DUF3071 domain-containing protein n=1 Tax=Actinomadura alba TaxID=406431 RepID=A0ABR7LJJ1_9ACTN|nr:septation protein SepH [Actinomadura alba]MBC6465020.1 DUF3071 domain-containing protein [Actinomadura alba]